VFDLRELPDAFQEGQNTLGFSPILKIAPNARFPDGTA
jgi:hypothetical protein